PVERAQARGLVLLRVPEGAVVDRVDGHVAVVAPAAKPTVLASLAREERRLALCELVRRIGREAARVADPRHDRRARGAEAERQVAVLVHRGASHPAPGRVRLVSALLDEARCAGGRVVDLEPADSADAPRGDAAVT